MIALDPARAAREAAAAHPERPATAVLLDTEDVRVVVFRLATGQSVPPHRSPSSVLLSVLAGSGVLSGETEERPCTQGDTVAYAPTELHGMRATDGELLLMATITPRPGSRPPAATGAPKEVV